MSETILQPGEVLGGTYEIRGLLGAGGFGEVHEALDRSLGRAVAIKIARTAQGSALLLREGRAMAAVRHPSMPAVHGLGEHRGLAFLVMERVYGVSLSEHMDRRASTATAFSVSEVLELVLAIAEGAAAVHRAGLVHHDVKPSNVMLSVDRRVVLTDLGFFASEFAAGSDEVGGSPQYMAPEIISNTAIAGARHLADVYGLGVVAFELLTGRVPFTSHDMGAVLRQHLSAPLPDPAASRPDAPPRLHGLIRAMLAKSPADRPQSMDVVARTLASIRGNEAQGTQTSTPSVLIVDDDEGMVLSVRALVRSIRRDAEVRTASDANSALRAIREAPPDFLMLDMQLPDMSGLQMCLYLRGTKLCDQCRIIMVSGRLDEPESELLRQLGVLDFVPKGPALGSRLRAVLGPLLS